MDVFKFFMVVRNVSYFPKILSLIKQGRSFPGFIEVIVIVTNLLDVMENKIFLIT